MIEYKTGDYYLTKVYGRKYAIARIRKTDRKHDKLKITIIAIIENQKFKGYQINGELDADAIIVKLKAKGKKAAVQEGLDTIETEYPEFLIWKL